MDLLPLGKGSLRARGSPSERLTTEQSFVSSSTTS